MYIKAKYPKTERWYMNIESQGYGSGTQSNVSNVSQSNTSIASSVVNNSVWNSVDQSSGTTTNENEERVINPPAPAVLFEVWGFINGGDNRASGNNVSYNDEDGNPVNWYVGNNGQEYIFKSNTSEPIATVTGDPYEMRRLFKGSEADMDTFYAANVGFGLVGNPIWDNGESVATVQAEYDAA